MQTIQVSLLGLSMALSIAACGDSGSGLEGPVAKLSAGDQMILCESVASESVEVDCGGGVSVTPQTVAQCAANMAALPDSCAYTVAQAESCGAMAPCDQAMSADCLAIVSCLSL